MAFAVRLLSPVIMTTSMPMLLSVYTANADSGFTVSAMANMAHRTPTGRYDAELGFRWNYYCIVSFSGIIRTIYSYQDSRLPFGLVAGHGGINVRANVVAVPPHPLSVPNQDGERQPLAYKQSTDIY